MEEQAALQDIRRRSVASLLRDAAHTDVLKEEARNRVRQDPRDRSLGVLPGLLPPSGKAVVVVFPDGGGEFGQILEAARQTVKTGTRQAAEELAQAARSLGALTTVPRQRLYRGAPPPPGPRPARDWTTVSAWRETATWRCPLPRPSARWS